MKKAMNVFSIIGLCMIWLFIIYVIYSSVKLCRKKKMTILTKTTLCILYLSIALVNAQLLFFLLTTRANRMLKLEDFLYSKCSLNARLLVGTT